MRTKIQLMEHIKKENNKDLLRVEVMCGDLLELAITDNDSYASAFAHTYLADAYIACRNHSSCIQHLKEAQIIAEDYYFYDLLFLIYKIGGIYYKSHLDEVTAIKYYLDAYTLAYELQNLDEEMMAFNNIAELFTQKKDYIEALNYAQKAYRIFLNKANIQTQNDIIVIVNLIQMYILNEQLHRAEELFYLYLPHFESFPYPKLSKKMILICEMYLAQAKRNLQKVNGIIDYFLENEICDSYNHTTNFSFLHDMYNMMLENKDRSRCEKLLNELGLSCMHDDIEQQLKLHLCWIQFAETFHAEDTLIQAYKQYYLLQKMVDKLTNKNKAESMKEKIISNQVMKERDEIEHEKNLLEAKVNIDELTQLFNRSYFNQLCKSMQINPDVTTLGFIVVDVDYFKEFNDYYGHMQGDELLKKIAHCLDENGDSRFFAARFGGDEFICLCVNVDNEDVIQYLEHVYTNLENAQIKHKHSKVSNIATISCGYSIFSNDETFQYETALTLADTALYKAKECGRNQFIEYGSDL